MAFQQIKGAAHGDKQAHGLIPYACLSFELIKEPLTAASISKRGSAGATTAAAANY